jgi:1-acyl-sn-glycerol-3-phosphate acyltransferase
MSAVELRNELYEMRQDKNNLKESFHIKIVEMLRNEQKLRQEIDETHWKLKKENEKSLKENEDDLREYFRKMVKFSLI